MRVCLDYRKATPTSDGRAVACFRGFSNSDPTSLFKVFSLCKKQSTPDFKKNKTQPMIRTFNNLYSLWSGSPAQLTAGRMLCEGVLSSEIAEKSSEGFSICWWVRKRQQRESKGTGRTWDPSKSAFDWRFQSTGRKKRFGYFWRVFSRKLEVNQTSTFSPFHGWKLPTKNTCEKGKNWINTSKKIPKPAKLLKHQFNVLHMWNIYMHLKPDEISQWLSYVTTRLH